MKHIGKTKKGILAVVLIAVYAAGFFTGSVFEKSNTPVTVSEPQKTEKTEKKVKIDKNETEIKELNKIKESFLIDFSAKYPDADLSFYIKNLKTGATLSHNSKKMNSASVIKLFIMETVFEQMADDKYALSDEKAKELEIMITESNNKASNGFIDDFGGVNEKNKVTQDNIINQTILKNGFKDTELNRKMHDVTPPEGPSGYENYTSVEDTGIFLEKLYNKTLLPEPYNTKALEFLKKQTRRTKIPSKITEKYPELTVANKTGELSHVENDAAIIMGDDFNIIFVVMVNDIPSKENGDTDYQLKEEVQKTISDFALRLTDFYFDNQF